jgi:hypothetical protein
MDVGDEQGSETMIRIAFIHLVVPHGGAANTPS